MFLYCFSHSLSPLNLSHVSRIPPRSYYDSKVQTYNDPFLMYVKIILAIGKRWNTLEPQQKELKITVFQYVSINFLLDIFFYHHNMLVKTSNHLKHNFENFGNHLSVNSIYCSGFFTLSRECIEEKKMSSWKTQPPARNRSINKVGPYQL